MRTIEYESGEMCTSPSLRFILISELEPEVRKIYFSQNAGSFTCKKDCVIELTAKLIEDEES